MKLPKSLTTITALSKALALILFVALPFLGFWLGIGYQKIVDESFFYTLPTKSSSSSISVTPTSFPQPTLINMDTVQIIPATRYAYLQIPLAWYIHDNNPVFISFSNIPMRNGLDYTAYIYDPNQIGCSAEEKGLPIGINIKNFYQLENNEDMWPGGKHGDLKFRDAGKITRKITEINGYPTIQEEEIWEPRNEENNPNITKSYVFLLEKEKLSLRINCSYKQTNIAAPGIFDEIMKTLVINPQ